MPEQDYSIYFKNPDLYSSVDSSAMIFFTSDGEMIFGLTVGYQIQVADALARLRAVFGAELPTMVLVEDPTPMGARLFREYSAKYLAGVVGSTSTPGYAATFSLRRTQLSVISRVTALIMDHPDSLNLNPG